MIRRFDPSGSDPLSQAWLATAQALALQVHCGQFRRDALLVALAEIRGLTRLEPAEALPQVVARLARCGVALVVVPEFKGLAATSASAFLSAGKALIAISLRYRREDGFYFRLFSEAGKLLAQERSEVSGQKSDSDPDGCDLSSDLRPLTSEQFARDMLIPPEAAAQLPTLASEEAIAAFAERIGISAGIVVGRMQWDGLIAYSQFYRLRRAMDEGFCALAQQGRWQTWLSVSEAAELARKDFPHLEIRPARAKVSEAAGRGAFLTNALNGQQRRCEPVSLDAWRLRQRDRDMAREEAA